MIKKQFFQAARAADAAELLQLERRSRHMMTGRLLLFFAAVFAFAAGWDTDSTAFYILSVLLVLAFILLLRQHNRLQEEILRTESHQDVLEQYLARFDGSWNAFEETGERYLSDDNPQGADLNLFGKSSLYQYLCAAHTKGGRDRLAAALSPIPGDTREIQQRQQAVHELMKRPELLLQLQTLSNFMDDGHDTDPLLKSLKSEGSRPKTALQYAAWVLTAVSWLSASAALAGAVSWTIPGLCFSLQFAVALAAYSHHNAFFQPLFHLDQELEIYGRLFSRLKDESFSAVLLQSFSARLEKEGSAAGSIRRLSKISHYANMRRNIFFFLLANTLLLTDFTYAVRFALWRSQAARELPGWLQVWSELELLMSLAVIGQTHETTAFPVLLSTPGPHLEAQGLCHPLLPEAQAVPNDMTAGSSTILITGSNMSGKTTWLRTLAVSTILAWSGAPVCAGSFQLTPLCVFTSIRVTDDITRGLSTFYAELLRIKSMMDFSKKKTPMLICIDEIFKGTNSADRIIGAREAIRHLTNRWCITLVSTHDFELCELQSPNDTPVENYHFEEHYEDDKILFDYTLKAGRCQTTNAKYLLRMAGILKDET